MSACPDATPPRFARGAWQTVRPVAGTPSILIACFPMIEPPSAAMKTPLRCKLARVPGAACQERFHD